MKGVCTKRETGDWRPICFTIYHSGKRRYQEGTEFFFFVGAKKDALARNLYGQMFLYLVDRANEAIGFVADVKLFVGVLDIFGFECFRSKASGHANYSSGASKVTFDLAWPGGGRGGRSV